MTKTKQQKRKFKRGLIPKGTPLPGEPGFKFHKSFLSEEGANKERDRMQIKDKNLAVTIVHLPRQHAIFKRRFTRITPKTPRLK